MACRSPQRCRLSKPINFRGLKGLGIPSSLHEQADSYASEVCIRFRIHPLTNSPRRSASEYKISKEHR